MDPRDILASLRRVWYVPVTGLLLAAGAATLVVTQVGPEYETQASVVLVPGDAVIPEDSNPFLFLGGGTALRDVLVRVVTSDEVGEEVLADRAPGTTYEVAPDPTTSGPIMLATTSAPTEEEALATLDEVLALLPAALEDVQEARDVPATARFTSMVLAQQQEATVNRSGMVRLLVAALGAVGVLTLFAAAWLDGRRRRAAPRHAPADPVERDLDDGPAPPAQGGGQGGSVDEPAQVEQVEQVEPRESRV